MSRVEPAMVFPVFLERRKQSEITKKENIQHARTTLAENPVIAPYTHSKDMAKTKVNHLRFFRRNNFKMNKISS